MLITTDEYHNNASKRNAGAEHRLQVSCVTWFRLRFAKLALLLVSIPNGAHLKNGSRAWKKLAAEGAVAGAPDLLLLVPSGDYGFLCVEMKTEKGRQQKSQKEFEREIVNNGGAYCIIRSFDQFQVIVTSYLETGEF